MRLVSLTLVRRSTAEKEVEAALLPQLFVERLALFGGVLGAQGSRTACLRDGRSFSPGLRPSFRGRTALTQARVPGWYCGTPKGTGTPEEPVPILPSQAPAARAGEHSPVKSSTRGRVCGPPRGWTAPETRWVMFSWSRNCPALYRFVGVAYPGLKLCRGAGRAGRRRLKVVQYLLLAWLGLGPVPLPHQLF